MSNAKVVETTDATLIGSEPIMLLSIVVGTTEPPPAGAFTVDLHNANSAGDTLNDSNRKVRLSIGAQSNGFAHSFDGVMFPKGLVVKCSSAVPITVEYE